MRKIKILVATFLIGSVAYAQQAPTGTALISPDWRVGGNLGSPGSPNIFGTFWNSPIHTFTNGEYRMIVNGTKSPTINNHTFARDGFVGIGSDRYNIFSDPINYGPFSLLHLNGGNGGLQVAGHHDWMKTGITFTDNSDLAYVGLRQVSGISNLTEFNIVWSNNPASPGGPDDFCFRFSNNQGSTTVSSNLTDNTDGDGLHIARFTGNGLMGMGPTFGVDDPIYVTPQSLIHLSYVNFESVYTQFTNRDVAVGSGTGENASDGLRVGIMGDANFDRNGNALIYQQEDRHLLFSTNANTTTSSPLNTNERIRVTSVRAPTLLANGTYGTHNPSGLSGNTSRVSISYDPVLAVTRPLSLMHLGYNAGATANPISMYGWREWMDIGTFTCNGKQNVYVGLKKEGVNDADAVVNWGGIDTNDNLRFIYTDDASTGTPASGGNGLEMARFLPGQASTLPGNLGMLAVGDFSTGSANFGTANAKVDIDGDLRIREVRNDNSLTQILAIDPTDRNRVRWVDANTLGGGGGGAADNGLSVGASGTTQLGQDVGAAGSPATLLNNRQIPMDGNNIQFDGLGVPGGNIITIGNTNSSIPFTNKVYTENDTENSAITGFTNGGSIPYSQYANGVAGIITEAASDNAAGVYGEASYTQFNITGRGVFGVAIDNAFNFGVHGRSVGLASNNNFYNYGGYFEGSNASTFNYGTYAEATGLSISNYGGYFLANASNGPSYGVYSVNHQVSGQEYAGWFEGDVYVNSPFGIGSGMVALISDQQFKTQITPISSASSIIDQLAPKEYFFDTRTYPQIKLSAEKQYGLISQEVERILPELVVDKTFPAQYDSAGVQTHAAVDYKALNYNGFIAILIKATQEQNAVIQDLKDRLSEIEGCIETSNLCDDVKMNNTERIGNENSITLENNNAIVLDQNLPNPFAENTVITYSIPEDVLEAKLLFYDMNGRVINQMLINERGESQLTVYGENLAKGIYTYSLIADGKLIATKKMVKK